jgi:ATP/maltotriose-dependent transcriptional regulator MalT
MAASGVHPNIGSGRRIIERPRLIKLLDETDARTILLLAPAGYGKTTLARQWLKDFSQVITITLSASHQDVAWLAEEFARAIEARNTEAARLIREHVRAHRNPARNATELGQVIGQAVRGTESDWLFIDNHEELTASREAESVIREIEATTRGRALVASRIRPQWASQRRSLYGEICEITHDDLAMTPEEITRVIGRHQQATARLSEQAKGWPAVIGLAASLDPESVPATGIPQTLHRYLAEEIFSRTDPWLRENLFALALLGKAAHRAMAARSPEELSRFVKAADKVGFGLSDGLQLHPLLRDFLLEKLLEEPNAGNRLREAVGVSLDEGEWENALELVARFDIRDLEDPALRIAFKPLSRSGRLASLKSLAQRAQARTERPGPVVGVVRAESEFCDGNFELANEIAQRVLTQLDERHALTSRAAAIVGQTALFAWDFETAKEAFVLARRTAQDGRDENEALYGLAQTTILGELPEGPRIVDELTANRHRSPTDLVRATNSWISFLHLGGGGLGQNLRLAAVKEALPHVADPRVRSSASYIAAYALSARAEYAEADEWLALFKSDAREFSLEFALPYGLWVVARVALGQRRYSDTERALQAVEDIAARNSDLDHLVNARSLRARLLLQNADVDRAQRCVELVLPSRLAPSWRAEFIATRALVMSVAGDPQQATQDATLAVRTTRAHEVIVLANVATAIAHGRVEDARHVIDLATRWNIWDPVVCGVRASAAFADLLASDPETRRAVESLYSRIQDVSLARRAGFRTRSTKAPADLLSPRETEVLELVSRGYTNGQISRALFISDSTTKVHVRHILEKLGVRTRTEAVARYEMFRSAGSGDGNGGNGGDDGVTG